jgi:putative oxidoreductase
MESIPRKGGKTMTATDLALLVIRIILGITFLMHGAQKLFGWFGGGGMTETTGMLRHLGLAHPAPFAWLLGLVEFVGGFLILIGLLTPLVAALLISDMLVAIVHVHGKNGFFNMKGGYEYNLNLIGLCLGLALIGAGTASVDYQVLGTAMPLDQLPAWVTLVVVIAALGGFLLTEFDRYAAGVRRAGTDQQQRA